MPTPENRLANSPMGIIFAEAQRGTILDGLQDYSKGPLDPSDIEHFNNILDRDVSAGDETTLTQLIAELQANPTDTATALKIQLLATKLGFTLNFITAVIGKITGAINTMMAAPA